MIHHSAFPCDLNLRLHRNLQSQTVDYLSVSDLQALNEQFDNETVFSDNDPSLIMDAFAFNRSLVDEDIKHKFYRRK